MGLDKNYSDEKKQITKIVVIEDNENFVKYLYSFFKFRSQHKIIHHFFNCKDAMNSESLGLAKILLLDIKLPQESGLEALPSILKEYPNLKVIVLTSFKDDEMLFEALQKGAVGYILKTDCFEHLENAIEQAKLGGMLFSPSMAQKILNHFKPKPVEKNNLTRRENEVLQLLKAGFTKKEMAAKLNISYNTVDTHVKNIYKKLNVNSNIRAANKNN
ncbi:LuxR C-terminal-related transcriptional regulator [Maribellus maritimus]|uniref:LuxR C-terminal-related transcriptional regulator n=1 Tax=Maribellus maritimus TaxID=2870838 RepID=UPI001EEB2F7E|nr:response regulator transcription factor [Maribellus maritimus]MCG6186680.1 response regulator transcription factor [Maribellus maritimus]